MQTDQKKKVLITWSHFVCVECTQTHGKMCSIQSCASGCLTKQAVEKKKDAVVASKAKATPILPIAFVTSADKLTPKDRVAQ